jgi:very-short-patch-repair endonuclease
MVAFRGKPGPPKGKYSYIVREPAKCLFCGVEFERIANARSGKPKQKFCSPTCNNRFNAPMTAARLRGRTRNFSPEVKEHILQALITHRAKIGKTGMTDIERIMANELRRLGYAYEYNPKIIYWYPDFLIPALNLVVECDGDYWHSLPGAKAADDIKDMLMASLGLKVVRLKGSDIKRNLSECINRIKIAAQTGMSVYPTCGEFIDRYVIEKIKSKAKGFDSPPAIVKLEFILVNILSIHRKNAKELLALINELCDINGQIWMAEDAVRAREITDDEKLIVADAIHKLNDERVWVKQEIDVFLGQVPEMKCYEQ